MKASLRLCEMVGEVITSLLATPESHTVGKQFNLFFFFFLINVNHFFILEEKIS